MATQQYKKLLGIAAVPLLGHGLVLVTILFEDGLAIAL